MSQEIEIIYNEHIADEKLKQGTKYERLAAIVFKTLNASDVVVHDLTLRGDGKKTPHQIDVMITRANVSKRVLIECKDYDTKVGISIIRDFFGAISQIKPDEAFVVTTEGYTKGARSFAEEEGIKLAILRGFKDTDWDGRIQKIHITNTFILMDTPQISWVATNQEEIDKFHTFANTNEINSVQEISTIDTYFYDEQGNQQENLQSVLKPVLNSFPRNTNSPTSGRYEFESTKYVKLAGVLTEVKGFDYEFTILKIVSKTVVDTGQKIALLLFKVIDGTLDKVIFDQDLDAWTFKDNGEVIPKDSV
ncbi:restriction endonuclease [Bacillus cereus group sp. TH260-2LC]|uniref:restriction endonuclease n=1 Tax=unclassified Bacillus cereus group TaxID=2750818 RepID=UPI0022E4DB58|nr:restriction endonuclease [Bacillus cereus group sp. TH260-2LC]MDA1531021.1 restriction endonuclease [Bacillus cereus group sp. TH260-2LC]